MRDLWDVSVFQVLYGYVYLQRAERETRQAQATQVDAGRKKAGVDGVDGMARVLFWRPTWQSHGRGGQTERLRRPSTSCLRLCLPSVLFLLRRRRSS
ncbi:hypothetical protein L226DRAFT_182328 [Lentinus tigrinus ALCF2SS1-7]|uniref:uncharacterized protein n=1 Tax=Lentinus tigrinus ALCF2SS1-7 TaxID=1328758 RepID=UPI001165EADA|nr:hypothetical protein L226DRAFT_182328 [Lentinus tigrinus ALCF2SS1-7]